MLFGCRMGSCCYKKKGTETTKVNIIILGERKKLGRGSSRALRVEKE